MLSIAEQEKLKQILEFISSKGPDCKKPHRKLTNIDATNRLRDQRGRFLPNQKFIQRSSPIQEESELKSDNSVETIKIRLVKIKGTYGTYLVKKRRFTDEERVILYVVAALTILAIIF